MPKRRSNPKLLGERAECAFLHAALDHGFIVSKPWGDSASYDFIVDSGHAPGRRISLVQVRCAETRRLRCYQIHTWIGVPRRPITAQHADFVAAYVFPERAWYIIPVCVLHGAMNIYVFPHNHQSRGRYEKFKEAWHLLRKLERQAAFRRHKTLAPGVSPGVGGGC